jgi:hypothetical protein
MSIIPQSFCVGVGVALIFGIFAGSGKCREWVAKLAHKNRKKRHRDVVAAK